MTRDIGKPGDSKDKGRRYRDTDNPRDIAGLPHMVPFNNDNSTADSNEVLSAKDARKKRLAKFDEDVGGIPVEEIMYYDRLDAYIDQIQNRALNSGRLMTLRDVSRINQAKEMQRIINNKGLAMEYAWRKWSKRHKSRKRTLPPRDVIAKIEHDSEKWLKNRGDDPEQEIAPLFIYNQKKGQVTPTLQAIQDYDELQQHLSRSQIDMKNASNDSEMKKIKSSLKESEDRLHALSEKI